MAGEKPEDRGDEAAGGVGDETPDPKVAAEETEAAEKSEADAKVKAEADVKAQAAADQRAAAERKPITIPKERFDEAVGKARRETEDVRRALAQAEARLSRAAGQIDAAKLEMEIEEFEDELEGAIADNNKDKSKAIRAEIRVRVQAISDARADAKAMYATAVAVEQIRYDALVTRMEIEHPELDPEKEETYEEWQVSELLELKGAFESTGLGSSEALAKALKAVYRGGTKPAETAEEKQVKTTAEARKAAAVAAGIAAKGKQAPDGKKTGADSDAAGKTPNSAADAVKMSDAAFAKLTPEELARARGDIL